MGRINSGVFTENRHENVVYVGDDFFLARRSEALQTLRGWIDTIRSPSREQGIPLRHSRRVWRVVQSVPPEDHVHATSQNLRPHWTEVGGRRWALMVLTTAASSSITAFPGSPRHLDRLTAFVSRIRGGWSC